MLKRYFFILLPFILIPFLLSCTDESNGIDEVATILSRNILKNMSGNVRVAVVGFVDVNTDRDHPVSSRLVEFMTTKMVNLKPYKLLLFTIFRNFVVF